MKNFKPPHHQPLTPLDHVAALLACDSTCRLCDLPYRTFKINMRLRGGQHRVIIPILCQSCYVDLIDSHESVSFQSVSAADLRVIRRIMREERYVYL